MTEKDQGGHHVDSDVLSSMTPEGRDLVRRVLDSMSAEGLTVSITVGRSAVSGSQETPDATT